jgi:Family of unknown function (DUF6282)
MSDADRDVVDRLLRGAVDPHCHPFPSPFPRRIDIEEAARQYEEAGFRAFVAKSHHHSTATEVALLERHGLRGSSIRTLGAIALNNQVGGLNPHAVNLCLAFGGKVVWFPTIASPAHIEHSKGQNLKFPNASIPMLPDEPIDIFDGSGKLKPEVHEILRMVAEADAVLAGGHMPPAWILALFEAARDEGVRRMVMNHPNFVIEASKEEALKAADLGAVIEHSICMYDEDSTFYHWEIGVLVDWIRTIGPERSQLGSDLGQEDNPLPVDSYRKICLRLLDAGLSEHEVGMLVADVPARLLGLDDAGPGTDA